MITMIAFAKVLLVRHGCNICLKSAARWVKSVLLARAYIQLWLVWRTKVFGLGGSLTARMIRSDDRTWVLMLGVILIERRYLMLFKGFISRNLLQRIRSDSASAWAAARRHISLCRGKHLGIIISRAWEWVLVRFTRAAPRVLLRRRRDKTTLIIYYLVISGV